MDNASTQLNEFLTALELIYGKRDRLTEFKAEKPVYERILPELQKKLGEFYRLVRPMQLGSTATVWEVLDVGLNQPRALKLSRPRPDRFERIVKVIRAEPRILAALHHQNLMKVYSSSELPLDDTRSLPFFMMEYLDGIEDFEKSIVDDNTLEPGEILDYFRDVLNGLSFLHAHDIIHCDIKPGNLLVTPGRPALVADLGYSKNLYLQAGEASTITQLITTHRYAHPHLLKYLKESTDPSAAVIELPRDLLDKKYDLYALGRTFQEVLRKLKDKERKDPAKNFGRDSVFTDYQWRYLSLISKRLLDGIVLNRTGTDLELDCISGLDEEVMQTLKYSSADEALEDVEKLAHLYDLEGEVPELNPNISSYIQICNAPL